MVPRQSALDWQFVELLHPAFTRRQQFFWGGLKNHKRPKKQGIVTNASDELWHEGVRVLGISKVFTEDVLNDFAMGVEHVSLWASRGTTASIDAKLQKFSVLHARARMFVML